MSARVRFKLEGFNRLTLARALRIPRDALQAASPKHTMPPKRTTIREELLYRYTTLIADAIAEDGDAKMQIRAVYWGFVTKRYRELVAGERDVASALRQNLQSVDHANACE